MTAPEITLRVVMFKDGDLWVAQCLEHDIGAQATTFDELKTNFNAVLRAELKESAEHHQPPLADIPPAPERFHTMWHHRARSAEINFMSAVATVPQIELRPALVA
jgi:hypothetical protein